MFRLTPARLASASAAIVMPYFAAAVPIDIVNHSFEDVLVPDNYYTVNAIPGWTGEASWYHIANPSDFQFAGTSDTHATSPIDGRNAAAVNAYGHVLYQTLNLNVMPGYTYTLSALVGHRYNVPFDDGTLNLIAGDRFLGRAFASPAEGTFTRVTVVYNSPLLGDILGQSIKIELRSAGAVAQSWFDDVHLDVSQSLAGTTPTLDTAYVPVPMDDDLDAPRPKASWPQFISFDGGTGPLASDVGVPDGGSTIWMLGISTALMIVCERRNGLRASTLRR